MEIEKTALAESDPVSVLKEKGIDTIVGFDENGRSVKLTEYLDSLDSAATENVASALKVQAAQAPGTQATAIITPAFAANIIYAANATTMANAVSHVNAAANAMCMQMQILPPM